MFSSNATSWLPSALSLSTGSVTNKIGYTTENPGNRSPQTIKTQVDGADRYGRNSSMHFGTEEWNSTAKQKRENTEGTTRNSNNPNSREMVLQLQIEGLETSNLEKDKKICDLNNQNERLKAQVDRLTMELAAAQAYAPKPDEYPGRDILRMVEGLNDSIFNTARSIHDLSAKVPRTNYYEMILDEPNYRERYVDLATKAIGEGLYKFTSRMDDGLGERDPGTPEQFLPLDLALQSLLVQWCSRVVSIFHTIADAGNMLAEAYEDIRSREDQPVSARWRVMTMTATRKWEQNKADDAVGQVLAVLCTSGMSLKESKPIDFEGKVLKRIQDLEKQALRLKYAMQEGITSGDMELISVLPGTIYDPASMQIEDGYGNDDELEKDEPVLCTVGLGLRKVVRKKNEKGDFELCTQVMKQATIVLQSTSALLNVMNEVIYLMKGALWGRVHGNNGAGLQQPIASSDALQKRHLEVQLFKLK